ncbi:MAG: methyltransferase domain-containing protein [Nanoarchaeota archaeon]
MIKKYFPLYEDKNVLFKILVERNLSPENIILDAGCGSGKETPIDFKNKVRFAVGIDLSEGIKFNSFLHVRIQADISKIPLQNNSVDVVLCQEVIEHLKEPKAFFEEVNRVLKSGGKFILMTPNLLGWRSIISRITPYWFHLYMNKRLYGIKNNDVFPTFYRANTYFTIKKLLLKNRFSIIDKYFFEPSPKTLTFFLAATYLEIIYTKLIKKFEMFKNFRETLIIVTRKQLV